MRETKFWSWRFEASKWQGICEVNPEKRWELARINGSHHVFTKQGVHERIVIPIHRNQPLKIGLLKAQTKLAGLSEEDL